MGSFAPCQMLLRESKGGQDGKQAIDPDEQGFQRSASEFLGLSAATCGFFGA
ncbi:hypothetical protein TDMWS_05460 [Thermodesulfomicrobium sp. WS]|nr:hypothetical protein TDMWS_05460 [Thermodesulfomicrobium sp. WS]